jgi:polyribonucleotide nucleotidyltransferase
MSLEQADEVHEKRKYEGGNDDTDESKMVGIENEMDVPKEKVAQIIGHKGSVIQEIMSRSGCRVVINQDVPEGEPNKALFTGNSSQIRTAKSLIQAVIEYGPGGLHKLGIPGNETIVSDTMECPQDKVGTVIGSKGVVVSEIMKRTNCKIVINQDVPDGSPAIVNITGPEDRILDVKECISKVIESGPQAVTNFFSGRRSSESSGHIIMESMVIF